MQRELATDPEPNVERCELCGRNDGNDCVMCIAVEGR